MKMEFKDCINGISCSGEVSMTKGEYCKSKGIHVYGHNLDEEIDDSFKKAVDALGKSYEQMYNENEETDL